MNIHYVSRDNRNGYKAGALKAAMELDCVKKCQYVAIFDADHQPSCDFLMRTIPFLIHNPKIALVQARWMFVNADECLMTRIQEMSLNYHFKVEQQSGSSTFAFFGFNGTAGVWRILAIQEAEGWKERTTVEDMDLAVRATLQDWKFVYIGDLEKVSIWKKFFLVYNFFFARRIVSYNVTFFFYCVVIPLSTFFAEIKIPRWGVIYIPTIITVLNAAGTPSSLHLTLIWIFFENVMSLHRCKAVYIGLFDAGRVNEWVVTEKLGNMLKTKPVVNAARNFQKKFWERFLFLEIAMGIFLFSCAYYDYAFSKNQYFIYIFPLSISFFIMGFGYVGIYIPVAEQVNAL
uniref:glucomannan 4-beta-mannosyltransferase n=1 Tax=Elaeis guineensis var. tenera TaxID=51953 RepID=A0A8N4F0D2_ELAGV|nr:glucomannan 4-beta-mannosyltransferase 1 isoform X2 [Elaeis guineensis]